MSYEKDQIAKKERRERIAVRCMQGMWGNTDFSKYEHDDMAITAVASADALIAELDREQAR